MHDGGTIRQFLRAATERLAVERERINRINTFPVPDGDSGTNMWYTLKAAWQAAEEEPSALAGQVARRAARGALLHARGNSGIILAQILAGLAKGLAEKESFVVEDWPAALAEAVRAAYRSVGEPVEGTMLTVLREGAEAAAAWVGRVADLETLFNHVVEAQRDALARTPELLPKLKEAGVVDAGGLGLLVIFEAMRDALRGQILEGDLDEFVVGGGTWPKGTQVAAPAVAAEARYGFEVQCLVRGVGLDLLQMRTRLEAFGESVLVVGDETEAKVHVHTLVPQAVVNFLLEQGDLSQLTFEDLDAQARQFEVRYAPRQQDPDGALETKAPGTVEEV